MTTHNIPISDLPDALPKRHHPAHPPTVRKHNRPTILHVTICTAARRELLATAEVHLALRQVWSESRQWLVGYYLIMPNHVHLFCAPGVHDPEPVKNWARYWKLLAGKALPELKEVWQSDCWDTQMRDQEHYVRKLEYVSNNPVRKGLVTCSEDWPYQGRLNKLMWILG